MNKMNELLNKIAGLQVEGLNIVKELVEKAESTDKSAAKVLEVYAKMLEDFNMIAKELSNKVEEAVVEEVEDNTDEIIEFLSSIEKECTNDFMARNAYEEHRYKFYTYNITTDKDIDLNNISIASHEEKITLEGETLHYVVYSNGIVDFYLIDKNNKKWFSNYEFFKFNFYDAKIYPVTINNRSFYITEELQQKLYSC